MKKQKKNHILFFGMGVNGNDIHAALCQCNARSFLQSQRKGVHVFTTPVSHLSIVFNQFR